MKKLMYIILGFIIGAGLTYYFCPRFVNQETIEIDRPTGVITILEAEKLSANWAHNNDTEIDSLIDVEGPRKAMRSVMWTLKDVEDYLYYAKHQSDSVGYTMTGVRIYLGNYGKSSIPSKRNRNTMFIVPTGHEKTSEASNVPSLLGAGNKHENIPVDPLNEGTGGNDGYPH
ncbi:hypothetical protein QLS71_017125 [Mariniflexile litorale]|uniref:Uncharacterized protein n=1 Tax=Mariniflexile litorale TaxID=3045158 RepID=A0AAU7EFB8_9FLAO|nr:hypothetical protein [Mariniflexile sp. KMM 9835]MDQ8211568.1 hypothetical protein [Mariniflexile sp. KMM 9835]